MGRSFLPTQAKALRMKCALQRWIVAPSTLAAAAFSPLCSSLEGEVAVLFDDRKVIFSFGELDTLVPAYAATIHKSQSSEYPAVVIPVMTQHYAMLQRNLIYTGVTRGKKLVRSGRPEEGRRNRGKECLGAERVNDFETVAFGL